MNKSPFYVVKNFISPLMCEDIISRLNHTFPEADVDDNYLKTITYNKLSEIRVLPYLEDVLPSVEQYYGFESEGILPFKFEWYVEGFTPSAPSCESYSYSKTGWVRTSDVGFSGVIFLNDYNATSPFDAEFEVYGGKLEFTTHQFGITPQRGLLVIYPEAPNFINTTGPIQAGELTQIRFHIVPIVPYKYNISNFPGNYKTWFKDL